MAKKTAKKTTEETEFEAVLRLRDEEGKPWAEIAEELGLNQGRCMSLYMTASVKPKDRIKFDDDDDLAKQVVRLREKDLLSWGLISARSGVGEGKLKRLFEEASGTPALGHRIGRGGRFPTNGDRPAPAEKAPKAKKQSAKAKKEAEVEAAAKVTVDPKKNLVDMTLPELQKRLNGKTITVARDGGKTEKIGVKNIKSYKNGEVVLVDAKGGKSRTVLMAAITKATR